MEKDKKVYEVSLLEHLEELRQRLIWSLVFFFLAFLVTLFWSTTLYQFLTSRWTEKLIVLGPHDILMIYFKLASVGALAFSLPFWVYQVWAYVKPALRPKEARILLLYIPTVFVCFLGGLAFGFFVVSPAMLKVLLELGENAFETQLTAVNYIAFLSQTTLPLGLFFEFPVMIAFLTSLGILNSKWLVIYRRYAYFTLIVAAVILTPADLISDLALSVPLIALYEMSIGVSRMIEKRRKENYGNS